VLFHEVGVLFHEVGALFHEVGVGGKKSLVNMKEGAVHVPCSKMRRGL